MRRALTVCLVLTLVWALTAGVAEARMRFGYSLGKRTTRLQIAPNTHLHQAWRFKHHPPAGPNLRGGPYYHTTVPRSVVRYGYECECRCYPSWHQGANVHLHVLPRCTVGRCATPPGEMTHGWPNHRPAIIIRYGY